MKPATGVPMSAPDQSNVPSETSGDSGPAPLPSPLRRNLYWFLAQMAARFFFAVWFRLQARGTEKLPAEGGALLLINHQSFLDPLIVGTPIPRPVSYLARDSLFKFPLLGWWLRHTYVTPIKREQASPASIKEIVRRLKHGFLVGIFPEGTRSSDGRVQKLRPGFVAVVRRAKFPVYPVGIAGTGDAMPRGGWFVRPTQVRVVFGDPFSDAEIDAYTRRGEEERFAELVRERITECQRLAEEWRRR